MFESVGLGSTHVDHCGHGFKMQRAKLPSNPLAGQRRQLRAESDRTKQTLGKETIRQPRNRHHGSRNLGDYSQGDSSVWPG